MRQEIMDVLNTSATTITTTQIIMNFCIAFLMGLVIFISYRTSHTRVVYSARFNVSLMMLTMITTLVMSVIGNNVALSLGMVGALSIVRFRTAVKDPRDTAYIFWCLSVGICCGVAEYRVAICGTAFIFVLLVMFGLVSDNNRYLLVIRADRENEGRIKEEVQNYYGKKVSIRVSNTTKEKIEMIYEISERVISKVKNSESVDSVLYKLDGVDMVNLVAQNDEMR